MREKSEKLVITFHTTTEAMKMETVCHAADAPGRLIPVPREITAGCGMSWCAPPDARAALEQLVQDKQVCTDGWYALVL